MAYKAQLRKSQKRKSKKNQADDEDSEPEPEQQKLKRFRDGYINKQHVLVLCTKGINHRHRHLMKDIRELMPHSKKDVKCDPREMSEVNEICEMKNCTSCVLFEARSRSDLYMWITKTPSGPSIKFHVRNVHTMRELKFTGNCLKGSRPIVTFDANFDSTPHYRLIKEVFMHVWPTPNLHPKSKPFIDHVINFYLHDDHIWFRNYQIVNPTSGGDPSLVEIGPRFVLNPVKILSGSFFGGLLYVNPKYVSPAALRGLNKVKSAQVHVSNVKKEKASKRRSIKLTPTPSPLENIFGYNEETIRNREAKKRLSQNISRRNSSEMEPEEDESGDENGESYGSEISEGDSLMNTSEFDGEEEDGENFDDENDDDSQE
jgi:ribosome biogenesis protein BRX1